MRQSSSRYRARLNSLYFLPTTSGSGAIHVENLSAHMTGLHQVKDRIGNVLYRRLLHGRLWRRVAWHVSVHLRVHDARGYGIEANAIFCILDCEILSRRIQPTLRDHRNRAVFAGDWPIGKRSSDGNDASRLLFQHLFNSALSDVEESEKIGGDEGVEVLGRELRERLVQEDAGVI